VGVFLVPRGTLYGIVIGMNEQANAPFLFSSLATLYVNLVFYVRNHSIIASLTKQKI
jgi:hypothetical protein